MQEMKLLVPTYFESLDRNGGPTFSAQETRGSASGVLTGNGPGAVPQASEDSDFGPPFVPVVIHEAEGVRIVLGTHDRLTGEHPDIQLERRPDGWAIFLHPVGASDPSAYVYFLDDGRSFVEKSRALGATPAMVVLRCHSDMAEIDALD